MYIHRYKADDIKEIALRSFDIVEQICIKNNFHMDKYIFYFF